MFRPTPRRISIAKRLASSPRRFDLLRAAKRMDAVSELVASYNRMVEQLVRAFRQLLVILGFFFAPKVVAAVHTIARNGLPRF
jgi:hypothetical protein